jgi:hypothetical protein
MLQAGASMNLQQIYEAGYLSGLEGDDACPHLAFTPPWWCWHAGHFVGHHTLCTQLEAIALLFE